MKRILSLCVAVLVLLSGIPVFASHTFTNSVETVSITIFEEEAYLDENNDMIVVPVEVDASACKAKKVSIDDDIEDEDGNYVHAYFEDEDEVAPGKIVTISMLVDSDCRAFGGKFTVYVDDDTYSVPIEETVVFDDVLLAEKTVEHMQMLNSDRFLENYDEDTLVAWAEENAFDGFAITNYEVDMIVNEDNSVDVTENIQVYFTRDGKHGINREIPIKFMMYRADGSSQKQKARITKFECSDPIADKSVSEGYRSTNKVFKIGEEDVTYGYEFHDYEISYHYQYIGDDGMKDKDEFYHNIIGTGWTAPIARYSFHVEMPKDFDLKNLGFSVGSYGHAGQYGMMEYHTEGNDIYGESLVPLDTYEGVTMRIELPEGYFKHKTDFVVVLYYIIIGLMIAMTLWSIFLYVTKYRRQEYVSPVNFYPPEGLDACQIGGYFDGRTVTNKHVLALLFSLAEKGCVDIVDKKPASYQLKITEGKKQGNLSQNEETFLNGLKNCGKSEGGVRTINKSDLQDKFYKTTDKIKARVTVEVETKVIDKETEKTTIVFWAFRVLCVVLGMGIPVAFEQGFDMFVMIVITGAFFLAGLAVLGKEGKRIAIGIPLISIPFFIGIAIMSEVNIVIYLVAVVAIVVISILEKMPQRRTDYGIKMLGEIEGFKDFLISAEKEKLEMLVEENPSYFYQILPYTYALGISDKWVHKFESMNLIHENDTHYPWYHTISTGHGISPTFDHFGNGAMSVPSSSGSSSGGGSFSGGGGGFSGGGGGGGGGSSW